MRIDLKKFLFYSSKGSMESFFNKAQELGIVEFIEKKAVLRQVPVDIENILTAIKALRSLPTQEQKDDDDADVLALRILELKTTIDHLGEKARTVKEKIEEIRPFGRFSLKDIVYIEEETGRKVQFFFTKRGLKNLEDLPESVIYSHSDNTFDYFIALGHGKLHFEKMYEMKFPQDLQALEEMRAKIQLEMNDAEKTLKSYSKYNQFLHEALRHKYNDFDLRTAKKSVQPVMEGAIFAIEGWVPVNKIHELNQFDVQTEEIEIEANDRVPTYLENEGFSRMGEDLVCFYDIPSQSDKDPSLWVLGSFALFFAIIVGDGGYGLIFLATALYLRYKNPDMKPQAKRAWKLFTLLCISCVTWGVLTNAFFGMTFVPDSPMRKVSLLNWLGEKKAAYHFALKDEDYHTWVAKYPSLAEATTPQEFLYGIKGGTPSEPSYDMIASFNDSALIEIALALGSIHICFSFLRYIRRNPTGLGWIIAIIGGYLYFPAFLNATSMLHYAFGFDKAQLAISGYYMIFTGIGISLCIALYQRKLLGILELTSLTAIFADVLSYLRLYALGLSGSVVTATINGIAGSIKITFVAVALWIVGHAINMALAVVGGVIHGLRLNFIEWYHYSFEGGGKAFNPLKKI